MGQVRRGARRLPVLVILAVVYAFGALRFMRARPQLGLGRTRSGCAGRK
jgi:hypothetical protein